MAMKTSIVRGVSAAAFLLSTLVGASAFAASPVPTTYTQQGRILDSSGAPVTKKVAITFTLYNDPKASAAANVLWTETQNITPDDGYFSAQLGDVTPIPAGKIDGSVLYIGIQVGSDDEMTPREEITSVPYATLAGVAASAASADSVKFTGITGIPAACAAGQFLKGFAADGTATCGTFSLSCHNNAGTSAAGVSSYNIGCDSGTLTGGACSSSTNAALVGFGTTRVICGIAASADVVTLNNNNNVADIILPPPITCDAFYCQTSTTTTITATARCCVPD